MTQPVPNSSIKLLSLLQSHHQKMAVSVASSNPQTPAPPQQHAQPIRRGCGCGKK